MQDSGHRGSRTELEETASEACGIMPRAVSRDHQLFAREMIALFSPWLSAIVESLRSTVYIEPS